ncbi:MAG: oxaloacetate decarboxylase [Haloferacaceae archaeon]
MSHARQFRELLDGDEIVVAPGAHDPLTARVLDMSGCELIHMTGYGTTLARSGYPDVGLATLSEVVENARQIAPRVDTPVFCDADNGYGDVKNTIRTVEQFVQAGVGGIHLEDQTSPKRGIVGGHKVVTEEEFVEKIRAACDVRDDRDEEFVVVARSDAPGAENGTLDDAIDRLNAAVDAGADVAFVIGQSSEEEVRRVGREVDAPLVYDWNGYHPSLDTEVLSDLGYRVVICSLISTRATMLAVDEWAGRLQEEGPEVTFDLVEEFDDRDHTFEEFSGFPEVLEWDERYNDGDFEPGEAQ